MARLAATVAPDAKTLRAIRKALTARDEAQVRLDAALITLEIVPRKPGTIEIIAAEETGRQEITPGTPVLVKGAPEVVVDLTGIALREKLVVSGSPILNTPVIGALAKMGIVSVDSATKAIREMFTDERNVKAAEAAYQEMSA